MGYFNVRLRPDMVNGDTTQLLADDNSDAAFAANDVLFDWTAVEIPKTCRLLGVSAVINGEDGTAMTTTRDIELIFARASADGSAPTTIGTVNATASSLGVMDNIIGAITLDKDTGATGTDPFTVLSTIQGGADQNGASTIVLDPTPTPNGTQTIYVAGIVTGAVDFSTGVLVNGAIDASAVEGTTITVDTVDARKCFAVGDLIYVAGTDTQIPGKVKSLTDTVITFDTTNSTVDVVNDKEVICATPVRLTLHCEM